MPCRSHMSKLIKFNVICMHCNYGMPYMYMYVLYCCLLPAQELRQWKNHFREERPGQQDQNIIIRILVAF